MKLALKANSFFNIKKNNIKKSTDGKILHFSVTLNTVTRKLMDLLQKYQMSRTVAFGRDVLNAPDVDIEDLLACLSPSEVQVFLFFKLP